MPSDKRHRRSTYVIDRRFQFKYTAIIVLIGAVIALVSAYFIYQAWRENTELLAISQVIAGEINRRESTKVFWAVGIFVVLEVVGLFLWGILVTHRIAGPLYIIDRYLGALRSGIYPDMRPLRRHDELQQFFESFSSTVDAFRERDQKELEIVEQVLTQLPAGELKEALQQVRDRKKASLHQADDPAPAATAPAPSTAS
ncbi:MAG: hypothetical protein ABIJ09_26825 [Pseudomonadota bacterium]